MDIVAWIEQNLKPTGCDSEAFFYDEMKSQSGYCLPVIYQPFNPASREHWRDRGSLFDFLYSVEGEGKTLLDFGPGDGWPSLIVAPFAKEVSGVDGSRKRVEVCTQNAARMGIGNARFLHVPPGCRLPFPDGAFDGVMAASSIEQTPDPEATLRELFRVLRLGGRLRVHYEGLSEYQGGRENEADLAAINEHSCRVTFYARDIEREQARMARLKLSMPLEQALQVFGAKKSLFPRGSADIECLERIRDQASDARVCRLTHPSGETLLRWMLEIGFREALPTHSGNWFAGQLFDQIPAADRPRDIEGVDALLKPPVKIAVQMAAPLKVGDQRYSRMITAVK